MQGTPRNMIKGKSPDDPDAHYWEAFAASPNMSTGRLMQALAIHFGWERFAMDVSQAYPQSEPEPEAQAAPLRLTRSMAGL